MCSTLHINSRIDILYNYTALIYTTILTILLHTYCKPIMYTRKRQACMDNVLTDSMHRVLSYMHTYWTLVPIMHGNNISI